MNVYIWFSADQTYRRSWKIYAVASDIGGARRMLCDERMHLPLDIRKFVQDNPPSSVLATPFVEVNISTDGKAVAWCAAGQNFGG